MRAPIQTIRWLAALVLLAASVNAAAAQTGVDARLLVLLRDASALAVVDPASGTVLGQVPTVSGPHEVTATPDGKLAFVASPSDGISVIDLETLTELRRLDIGAGSEPHDVRFADGKLYFTVEGFKAIGRYDPQADEVDWLLGLGQDGTHMMVLSRDRDTIFTANRESDTVSIIEDAADGPPDWQVTSIPADGAYPEGLDLSPDGAELWVATRNDGDVSIIDVASKTVSERLDLNFEDPNRLAFTPDGARVLVSDSATSVVVMEAASRTEITRLDMAPNALLVRPDGGVAYAALRGDDRVAVIDMETLEVVGEIPTGADSGPGCMFWLDPAASASVVDAASALTSSLTFHASFDNGLDADRAAGDSQLYTAPSYDEQDQAEPGLGNPAVMLADDAGRFGHALRFTERNQHAIFYKADGNVGYSTENWSGTVSFWLSLDPATDLEPGFCDPIQITDAAYNDAAIWVDFTGENPRQFRLGVFGDLDVWNPDGLGPNDNPAFTDRLTVVDEPPFAGDRWTHVAITYAGLGQTGGTATLYLDGERVPGGAENIAEPFTWDVDRGAIRLGVNYVGLFDELSLYDRPLTADEVRALHALDGGVAALAAD